MKFNFTCNACTGRLCVVRTASPQDLVVICGACGVRYHIATGPDRHVLRYLGNLDPVFPAAWERNGGRHTANEAINAGMNGSNTPVRRAAKAHCLKNEATIEDSVNSLYDFQSVESRFRSGPAVAVTAHREHRLG